MFFEVIVKSGHKNKMQNKMLVFKIGICLDKFGLFYPTGLLFTMGPKSLLGCISCQQSELLALNIVLGKIYSELGQCICTFFLPLPKVTLSRQKIQTKTNKVMEQFRVTNCLLNMKFI